jgi:hypothetical protein
MAGRTRLWRIRHFVTWYINLRHPAVRRLGTRPRHRALKLSGAYGAVSRAFTHSLSSAAVSHLMRGQLNHLRARLGSFWARPGLGAGRIEPVG